MWSKSKRNVPKCIHRFKVCAQLRPTHMGAFTLPDQSSSEDCVDVYDLVTDSFDLLHLSKRDDFLISS